MNITRISAQGNETLRDFYAREAERYRNENRTDMAGILMEMAKLLEHLEASVDGRSVFGVTSHFRLRLVTDDDYRSPTIVTVEPDVDVLDIAFPLPLPSAPWENAWVHGTARNAAQASNMVVIALQRSANSI